MADKWMQSVNEDIKERGTKGSLTRLAKKAGMSPMAFARKHYHDKGKVGQKSRFAVNANKKK